LIRLELRDQVKRLEREPREEEKKDVDRKRHLLGAEFELLEGLQRRAVAATGELNAYKDVDNDFDNLDEDIIIENLTSSPPTSISPAADEFDSISPENRPLMMPSTCLHKEHPLRKVELRLRKVQANRYLTALREIIAAKSFQYTHVIRAAPRKNVITRARNTILQLNYKILFYSKVYDRCRDVLIRLAADVNTLQLYRKLTKQDLKASSAVMDPNTPGSTSLSLSWIWQVSTASERSPASLQECTTLSSF
jgi:hypothetical protein